MKKILMIIMMVVMLSTNAFALDYIQNGSFQAGDNTWPTENVNASLRLYYVSGVKSITFPMVSSNFLTGPAGDALVTSLNYQSISGVYSLGFVSSGIYSLSLNGGGYSTISATDGTDVYFTGLSKATQINFNNNTISWNDITDVNIPNGIGSNVLTAMDPSTMFRFTTFAFQEIAGESAWLSGTSGTKNTQYYSSLGGFSAVPEPAEWILMIVGLGMMYLYLRRLNGAQEEA